MSEHTCTHCPLTKGQLQRVTIERLKRYLRQRSWEKTADWPPVSEVWHPAEGCAEIIVPISEDAPDYALCILNVIGVIQQVYGKCRREVWLELTEPQSKEAQFKFSEEHHYHVKVTPISPHPDVHGVTAYVVEAPEICCVARNPEHAADQISKALNPMRREALLGEEDAER